MKNILFVCLGNICRSAIAEGVLRDKIVKMKLNLTVDSAGTANYHTGKAPDERMQQKAIDHGLNISTQKARQFNTSDFDHFDYIFAMDKSNQEDILRLAKNEQDKNKVSLFLNFSYPEQNKNVPDPYYGGEAGFEEVYQLIDAACDEFIDQLNQKKH